LFSFFNEVIIAPFIHPNAHAQATPIILSTDGVAPTDKNEVIIPKINVQLPVTYSQTTNETDIQNSLEDGIIHYPTTTLPGQGGNAAFFGHSSNNIFNKGKYKFAFVLLHELEPGDVFYVTHEGKAYTYKVFQKKIVEPTDIGVLNPVPDKPATVTLITCDPPGTSLRRLVVWGEQITPDPTGNTTAAPAQVTSTPAAQLPSNSPSLWSRVTSWFQR
jgi:LPXTG-site transpeptidase (sortase) family protein